ncbi:gamma-glutamyltransferase [Brucella rhizosphaerae]|uniref:gamma-glutamyltransferase n=1 Tax=Brucella rhizosphaerae TaxID=571254 RepID=UPI0036173E5B
MPVRTGSRLKQEQRLCAMVAMPWTRTVTTALVLSVVEPWLSGVGGGGFLLRADGKDGSVDGLDFNVVSPRHIDPADYPLAPGNDGDWFNWPKVVEDRNLIGYSSICVPGAIAGLACALERFGSISFAEALQPAIDHAWNGLQIDWFTTLCLAIDTEGLNRFPASNALFLDNGRAPRVPETGSPRSIPMPRKAAMLERLAHAGARDFYEGEIAEKLIADLRAGGSRIDKDDLRNFHPEWKNHSPSIIAGQPFMPCRDFLADRHSHAFLKNSTGHWRKKMHFPAKPHWPLHGQSGAQPKSDFVHSATAAMAKAARRISALLIAMEQWFRSPTHCCLASARRSLHPRSIFL